MLKSVEIRKQMDALQASLGAKRAEYEQRGDQSTVEERAALVKMTSELKRLCDELDIAETSERAESALTSAAETAAEKRARTAHENPEVQARKDLYKRAFYEVVLRGTKNLHDPELAKAWEQRALLTTAAEGAAMVPDETMLAVEAAMKAYGQILEYVDWRSTATGGVLPVPTMNDTSRMAARIAQNTAPSALDPSFATFQLMSYSYAIPEFIVARQALRDAVIAEREIVMELAKAFARGFSRDLAIGATAGGIRGIISNSDALAPVGVTAASNSAITNRNIIDLIYSIDDAYQTDSRLAFNRFTQALLHGATDSQGRPLYNMTFDKGMPSTVNGAPFFRWADLPNIGASAKPIVYGDFRAIKMRTVGPVQVQMLEELYARQNAVGFIGFWDADARLCDAGGNPLKVLQMAA